MTDTKALTVRVPRQDLERLDALAHNTKRSKSELASEALAAYFAEQEGQIAAIRAAVEAADAGAPRIPHAQVVAWVESWGTAHELPKPG
jgi:predicted transcriptional regulator